MHIEYIEIKLNKIKQKQKFPVSSLLGSLQQLWNHHEYAKFPPFHLLLQIHLILIFLPSW